MLHNKRIAFAIINDVIYFLYNNEKSHYDWLVKDLGMDESTFVKITRGMFLNNNLYFYENDFKVTDNVRQQARKHFISIYSQIERSCKIDYKTSKIYLGMNKGEVSRLWEPIEEMTW